MLSILTKHSEVKGYINKVLKEHWHHAMTQWSTVTPGDLPVPMRLEKHISRMDKKIHTMIAESFQFEKCVIYTEPH